MYRLRKTAILIAIGEMVGLGSDAEALAQTTVQPVPSFVPTGASRSSIQAGPNADSPTSTSSTELGSSVDKKAAQTSSPGAGYSWRSATVKHKSNVRPKKQKIDVSRPQARGPEFVVTADGMSRISVQLSRRVEVVANANHDRHIYDLPNVQVAVANDMNPLVTTHFSTPIRNVKLVSQGRGARLIVDLREPVMPTHEIRDVAGGAAVLEVTLPKSAHAVPRNSQMSQQQTQSSSPSHTKKHGIKQQSSRAVRHRS
jgi:hypothetical protein